MLGKLREQGELYDSGRPGSTPVRQSGAARAWRPELRVQRPAPFKAQSQSVFSTVQEF